MSFLHARLELQYASGFLKTVSIFSMRRMVRVAIRRKQAYSCAIVHPARRIDRILLTCAAALAVATVQAQGRTYLNIGDDAPLLRPAKWLKGEPIKTFEKGQVYVVEFWATWCNPCKENIPHLTEMAKKYAGKVSVIGVDVWESNDPTAKSTIPKVAAFVKEQGARMDYHVAADSPKNVVADAWLKKADESGLPVSFMIGKDGKVAWIGHPSELPKVLEEVVADRFDVAAARAKRALEVETTRPIREAITAKEFRKVLLLTEAAIAKKPESERFYTYDRMVALFHVDLAQGKRNAETILEESQGDIGAYRMLASIFASQKDLSKEAYRYGREVIDKALLKEEMKYLFLAMGAEVDSSLGDKAGAVRSQEAAVKAAEVDVHAPKEFVEFLRKNLAKFKEAAKTKTE